MGGGDRATQDRGVAKPSLSIRGLYARVQANARRDIRSASCCISECRRSARGGRGGLFKPSSLFADTRALAKGGDGSAQAVGFDRRIPKVWENFIVIALQAQRPADVIHGLEEVPREIQKWCNSAARRFRWRCVWARR